SFAAWAAGEPVSGQVQLSFDGGKTHKLRFNGNSFVVDSPKRAKRFDRMVQRLRTASSMQMNWGRGGGMIVSLRGSSAAIGDCK
ncbi:MAG: hypothetical protein AAF211_34360, partial [Myxococcota bacterium]